MKTANLVCTALLLPPWAALRAAEPTHAMQRAPITFIYADAVKDATTLYDIDARWAAIPEAVRPFAWLDLSMPIDKVYEIKRDGDRNEKLPVPVPVKDYPENKKRFYGALQRAQEHGIKILLSMKSGATLERGYPVPEMEKINSIEGLLQHHTCIAGLLTDETASYILPGKDVTQYVRTFAALAKKYQRKFFWDAFMGHRVFLWNYLMTDGEWPAFMKENNDTMIPMWKSVEPDNNMLNWAGCVGLWLAGLSDGWGCKFDSWFYTNYIANKHHTRRETFYPAMGKNMMGTTLMSCPPYLLKDFVLLAALTGSRYFTTERNGVYDYAARGPLRPVLDKTYEFIVKNRLWRSKEEVRSLCKVAVETPADQQGVMAQGYTHSDVGNPNILWKQVLGIEDGGIDLIPKEGKNYIVPIIPPEGGSAKSFRCILTPRDVADSKRLSSALNENHPRRFVASDPNVLIFDAGDCVYVTDSRDENRTTLEFTLESQSEGKYQCLFLAPDATSFSVEPATQITAQGWVKKILLPSGCSMLFLKKGKSP